MAENIVSEQGPSANDLVFALAHEIGNYLGAIRLQAHLLDDDLDPRSLAGMSVEIDGLAGRAGPLLALLRPILSPAIASGSAVGLGAHRSRWSGLLGGLGQQLEDEGTRGVRVEIEAPADSDLEAPAVDWLHSLLVALVGSTLSAVSSRGTVAVRVEARGAETLLVVEDDGAEEDLSAEAALRGRPLILSLARRLIAGLGGRVESRRVGDKTRVELVFR